MPFRMTRQIRNLTMPLREKGLIEGTMINTLRALRNNSDLLLSTMDVFVKEPSVDWQVNCLLTFLNTCIYPFLVKTSTCFLNFSPLIHTLAFHL